MKKVISGMLLTGLWLIAGCSSIAEQKDIVRYAENPGNGLRKKVTVGNCTYTIQYKPAAYILFLEHTPPDQLGQRRQQLDSMAWFNISFHIEGFESSPLRYKVSGLGDYDTRLNYYLNDAAKDMYLLYGKDTLYPVSYWFENNQNLTAAETMIAGFRLRDGDRPDHDLHFAFYDRVFQNGIIKTIIRKADIDHIPDIQNHNM